jgi:nitrite reductase/ring-hydroxylating ferredoxin subunit
MADPETLFAVDVIGEPVVIVRDKQDTLRAFSNVCRHRAGPITQGSGCKNVLRCGYHGWTYALDGRLIGTPDVEGAEFFNRSTMGMVPLRLETWEQLIFVNLNSTAQPLSAYLGKIPEQACGFQFEGLQSVERRDYIIVCNWRVYVRQLSRGLPYPYRALRPDARNRLLPNIAQTPTATTRRNSLPFVPSSRKTPPNADASTHPASAFRKPSISGFSPTSCSTFIPTTFPRI